MTIPFVAINPDIDSYVGYLFTFYQEHDAGEEPLEEKEWRKMVGHEKE